MQKVLGGASYSFGSRFDSSVGNKNHVRPRKAEGPGPGSYKMPGAVTVRTRHPSAVTRTTFGTAGREFVDLPKWTPAPNKYAVDRFPSNRKYIGTDSAGRDRVVELSPGPAFGRARRTNDAEEAREALLPGPQDYDVMKAFDRKEDGVPGHLAKSILGGSLDARDHVDNGVPGPGAYHSRTLHSIPGFVMVDPDKQTTSPRTSEADIQKR